MFEFHHAFEHKILKLEFDMDRKKLKQHLNLHTYHEKTWFEIE